MSSKRRREYLPISGKYSIYHKEFDKLRTESAILNGKGYELPHRGLHISVFGSWNKNNVGEALLNKSKDLEFLKVELEKIEFQFRRANRQGLKEGRISKVMSEETLWTKYPKEFEKKLKIEACIDVLTEEFEELSSLQSSFNSKTESTKNKNILSRGPLGFSQLQNGTVSEIDGQQVSIIEDEPIITCSKSPYYGMRLFDYKERIVKPWNIAKNEILKHSSHLRSKLEAQHRINEFDELWKVKKNEIFEMHPEFKDLFSFEFNQKLIPRWPQGVNEIKVFSTSTIPL